MYSFIQLFMYVLVHIIACVSNECRNPDPLGSSFKQTTAFERCIVRPPYDISMLLLVVTITITINY